MSERHIACSNCDLIVDYDIPHDDNIYLDDDACSSCDERLQERQGPPPADSIYEEDVDAAWSGACCSCHQNAPCGFCLRYAEAEPRKTPAPAPATAVTTDSYQPHWCTEHKTIGCMCPRKGTQ